MSRHVVIGVFLIVLFLPSLSSGKAVTSDTVWSGDVHIEENTLIPAGRTVTITPGTTVKVSPSENTKTDPEFLSFRTEITVRGKLIVNGSQGSPVRFVSANGERSSWAGIIVDGGSTVIQHTEIEDAETGIDVVKGSLDIRNSLLAKNRYGLVLTGADSSAHVMSTVIKENDYGIVLLNSPELESKNNTVKNNRKKDIHSSAVKDYSPKLKDFKSGIKQKNTIYNDEVFLGTVVWQGRVEVRGAVRVPGNARLVILPGTVVEFSKKDTNNDGIGENGLFIQGGIIAKGTKDEPIIFRSAEKQKGTHDWDSVNILNSDRSQNLIEYCQIENAYRGLHFHFANVAVVETVIRNNARGIQFQESIVEIRNSHFYNNKSALWARDSEIMFMDNLIYQNYSGINMFRNTLTLERNSIINNSRGGLRVREGIPVVTKNLIDGNRYGLLIVDAVYGTFSGNVISSNHESGISLRGPVNIEVHGNVVQGNGLNGIRIQDSSAVIRGNLISGNGERGIGVLSFSGVIKENNILNNGLYNLGIDGVHDVAAPANWWGEEDPAITVYDKNDDFSKGRADILPVREKPVILTWPLTNVQADSKWQGIINIKENLTVNRGIDLAILPGTSVLFSEGAGLVVKGRISARGEKKAPVRFAALNNDSVGMWDEIRLEYADGSVFSDCIIKNATWALHVHFTDLKVENCSILKNYGGMRFRSGPVEIRNSIFQGNEIGLRTNMGIGLLTDSLIEKNRIGIFVREKGSLLKIRRNNLVGNSDYNIRVGDFNDENIDARENWWGGGDPGETIFDERYEPGIGKVNFIPYEEKAFAIELPAQ